MRIEIICTGRRSPHRQDRQHQLQLHEPEARGRRAVGALGHDGRRRSRKPAGSASSLPSQRADAVIVNGGLGPTVDDLSQEIAAQAAGVELVLNEEWLEKMETFFSKRSRIMPPNNRKQAMLPDDRGDHRQPDRHRLRLRARYRQGTLLLHAGRAARVAPDAGGAGDPASARPAAARQPRSISSASIPTASANPMSMHC